MARSRLFRLGPSFDALDRSVERFVEDVADALRSAAPQAPSAALARLRDDVSIEAATLMLAVMDADDRHTDDEFWAYARVFGPRLDTGLAGATPAELRRAGLAAGKKAWLAQPSAMLELLLDADRRAGSRHANTYYQRAIDLAFEVCSLDTTPTETELRAVDAWRTVLLSAFDQRGLARPGTGMAATAAPPAATGTPAAPTTATVEVPAEPPEPIETLMAELDGLIGLAGVKTEVRLVTNFLRVSQLRKARGLPTIETSRHLVFTGNPGTGKTTVARLLARIYRSLGVVETGQLVETDRSGLVSGFVGQTATKVVEVFDRAHGGVLLIDEAYALVRGGEKDFGREAIDTIVKLVEDRRDSTVVIVAGYPDEMGEFIDANPGLKSRFPKTIAFPDYTDDELVAIFESMCAKARYEMSPEFRAGLTAWFAAQPRTKGFGNGRLARNLFEAAIAQQATRLMASRPSDGPEPSDHELLTLELVDLPPVDVLGDPARTDRW